MLVTFRTKAHADITMFGEVAVELLKLGGMTGAVPTAILADDIAPFVERLERGLASREAAEQRPDTARPERERASADARAGSRARRARADDDAEKPRAVPLRHRALPLLELLRSAQAAGADVIISVLS